MLYLKQKVTNRIYVYTEGLKQRDDMEPYTPDVEKRDFSNLQEKVPESATASGKDWRKLTKKSDLAEFAKMNDGIDLDQETTLFNMRAAYTSALQAKENGESILAQLDALQGQSA